jgi:hypothetical protein
MNEALISLFIKDLCRQHPKGVSIDSFFTVLLAGTSTGNGAIVEYNEPNTVFFLIGDPTNVIVSDENKKYEYPIDLNNGVQDYVFHNKITIQNKVNAINTSVKIFKISLL